MKTAFLLFTLALTCLASPAVGSPCLPDEEAKLSAHVGQNLGAWCVGCAPGKNCDFADFLEGHPLPYTRGYRCSSFSVNGPLCRGPFSLGYTCACEPATARQPTFALNCGPNNGAIRCAVPAPTKEFTADDVPSSIREKLASAPPACVGGGAELLQCLFTKSVAAGLTDEQCQLWREPQIPRGDYFADVCLGENAKKGQDPNTCRKISIPLQADICLMLLIRAKGDAAMCKGVVEAQKNSFTECAIVEAKNGGGACHRLTDLTDKIRCQSESMHHRPISFCSEIESEKTGSRLKEMCLSRALHDGRGRCADLKSQSDRALCTAQEKKLAEEKAKAERPNPGSPKSWSTADALTFLRGKDPKLINQARERLLNEAPGGTFTRQVVDNLVHPNRDVRLAALWILLDGGHCSYLGPRDFTPVYTALKDAVLLPESDFRINVRLAKRLIPFLVRDKARLEGLVRDLSSQDRGKIAAAAQSLGELRHYPATPKMIELLEKGGHGVKREIHFGLYEMTNQTISAQLPHKWKAWWKENGKRLLAEQRPAPRSTSVRLPRKIDELRQLLVPGTTYLAWREPRHEIPHIRESSCVRGFREKSGHNAPSELVRYWGIEEIEGTIYLQVEELPEYLLCKPAEPPTGDPGQDGARTFLQVPLFTERGTPYLWIEAGACEKK